MSGSGSGLTMAPTAPPTCSITSLRLSVSLFDPIITELMQLNCVPEEGYELVFKSSAVGLNLHETDDTVVFADYYDHSNAVQSLSIKACNYDILLDTSDSCSDELDVHATIGRHNEQLLPFDEPFTDGTIRNADDISKGVFLSNPIPFWGRYYNSIYVSVSINIRNIFKLVFILCMFFSVEYKWFGIVWAAI